ncbi:prolyl oligopeptidase family serine peptidase [bacterium]|nr:prolyl oligopeptidase family serine peptidase [bacterium]
MRFQASWVVPRFLLLSLFATNLIGADAGSDSKEKESPPTLSIESIYEKNEFNAKGYSGRWADDSSGYYRTVDSAETKGGKDIVLIDPKTGDTNIVVAAQDLIPPHENSPLSVESYMFSKDRSKLLIFTNSKRVWRTNERGDYWVLDRTSLELDRIGGDAPPSSLMFAKFSPDGKYVGYAHDRNLYVEELRSGRIKQLTATTSDTIINGSFDWVYEEEFEMHDGWRWSPNSDAITFWQVDTSGVRRYPLIDNVSGLYPEIEWIPYPKTGEVNSSVRAGVVSIDGGEIRWFEVPGDPRNHYIHSLEWPEHGNGVVIQQLNRLQNTNKFFIGDPTTGSVRELFEDTDAAWVDVREKNRWAGEGNRFPWLSERDGWRHLYAVDAGTGKMKKLFDDPMDVISLVRFVKETGDIYFIASPTNATQRYLYRTSIKGGSPKRITPADQPGTHGYNISPDGKWAIHTWSSFDVPPVVDLVSPPDHKQIRVLEDNAKLKEKLAKLNLPPVEFFKVPIEKDVEVDAYCIKPPNFDPSNKYPAIVYVYGEPAGQTVRDTWQGGGGLWHRLLAKDGAVVFSFDNRGTPAPKGRAWRKSIYRQVGILAAADQAAALRKTLEERPYLDPKRVGVWGWSGGGSMTLDAMFKNPDLYAAGIAVASVPNMRLYDTIYQERYMGLPDDNVDGYRNGSSINFAQQLKGNLLIVHGTGDDNVHYQGVEALIDRLEFSKKHFELMIYPNRTHGIFEGQNTTLHLRETMLDFWRRHLLGAEPGKAVDEQTN